MGTDHQIGGQKFRRLRFHSAGQPMPEQAYRCRGSDRNNQRQSQDIQFPAAPIAADKFQGKR